MPFVLLKYITATDRYDGGSVCIHCVEFLALFTSTSKTVLSVIEAAVVCEYVNAIIIHTFICSLLNSGR